MDAPSEMSQKSKNEYIERMRFRYQSRGREGKSKLLDELEEVCSLTRKHAIKLMNQAVGSTVGRIEKRGRKTVYAEAERKVVKVIWLAANQPCGKLLQPMVKIWLPHYEKEHGRLGSGVRKKLKAISARSIDRLLAPVRATENRRRNSGTKPGTLIKTQIPIRTDNDDIDQPGYIEADTVAHCGGSLEGDFVWTVDLTDVETQWTECRAVWNKGQYGVVTAIADIEQKLPFPLLAFDSDNGSEFLNWHLVAYLQERGEKPKVAFTRSRPYRKNDNARVEQKNWTHARQLLGYDRLDLIEMLEPLNEAYRNWNLLKNYFTPVMKLTEKLRIGGRYQKKYDAPTTPADRVLSWPGLDKKQAAGIRKNQRTLNPFELSRAAEASIKEAFEILKKYRAREAERDQEMDELLASPLVPLRSQTTTSSAPSTSPKAKPKVSNNPVKRKKTPSKSVS